MKKDIKKSSYYVWFLGAEEAKGLRGREFMVPVIRHLVEREKEVEPFKVTLQVSHKGLKIVQNVPAAVAIAAFGPTNAFSKNANAVPTVSPSLSASVATNSTKNGSKTEAIKHFIPHQAITSVYQEGDLVSCILLLFNPITKCPVHVHVYRCDSIETAEILCGQLQTLLDRPENRKKLDDIESRLRAKGLVQQRNSSSAASSSLSSSSSSSSSAISGSSSTGGAPKQLRKMPSNGASSTRDSDLSVGSSGSDKINVFGANSREPRITNLYDSLAAELKEKLCTSTAHQNHAPILLPPRDYDTVHRQKGNLFGIDLRRCLNMNIVGVNAATSNAKNRVNVAKLAGDEDKLRRRSTPEVCADNKPSSPPPIHSHANFAQQQQRISAPIAAGAANSQTKIGSSGESSGIGSDHAPSPDHEGNQFLDNQSTSDEEWNFRPSPDTIFLMQNTNDWHSKDLSLPRARRRNSNSGGGGQHDPSDTPSSDPHLTRNSTSSSPAINAVAPSNEFERRQKYLDELRAVPKLHKSGFFDENSPKREPKVLSNRSSSSSSTSIPAAAVLASASSPTSTAAAAAACKKRCPEERQRSSTPTKIETTFVSPKERFKDAKEKFQLLERERLEEREKILQQNLEKRRAQELAAVVAAAANKHPQRSSSHSRRIQDDERDFDTKIARQYANESDHCKPTARSPYHYRNKSTENLRRDSDEYDPTGVDYAANVGGRKRYQQYHASDENVDGGKLAAPSFASKHQRSFYDDEPGTDSATGIGLSRYADDNRQFYAGRDRRSVAEISAPSAAAPLHPRSHRPETARSFSENCLPAVNSVAASKRQYDREYNYGRPRDVASVQHSVPPNFTVAVGDESIPLRRYCSASTANNPSSPRLIEGYSRMLPSSPQPTSSSTNTNSTHFAYPYHGDDDTAAADEGGQLHQRERRIKRSESNYRSTANNNMEKRRSTASNDCCAGNEDEKRRNSNEIAKEIKRNFYQDHRAAAELSYQHAGTTNGSNSGYHETANNFDRYASNSMNEDCQEVWSPHRGKLINKNTRNYKGFANGIPTPSPPPPPIASPRYRHSYAEPFHHQSSPPIQQYNRSHDILQRRNSSLSSGRVGIAAVHRY